MFVKNSIVVFTSPRNMAFARIDVIVQYKTLSSPFFLSLKMVECSYAALFVTRLKYYKWLWQNGWLLSLALKNAVWSGLRFLGCYDNLLHSDRLWFSSSFQTLLQLFISFFLQWNKSTMSVFFNSTSGPKNGCTHGCVYTHVTYFLPWMEQAAATGADSMLSSD